MAFLSLDITSIFDLGCTLPAQNHYTDLLVSTLAPLAILFLVAIVGRFVARLLAKNDRELREEIGQTSFTTILVIVFLVGFMLHEIYYILTGEVAIGNRFIPVYPLKSSERLLVTILTTVQHSWLWTIPLIAAVRRTTIMLSTPYL